MQPFHDMMKPFQPKKGLIWSKEGKEAFEIVKKLVSECPKLYFIDETAEVIMQTDACNTGMGAYLFQRGEGGEHPIAFISKVFDERLRK